MCGRYIIEDNENAGEMKKILTNLKRHYGETHEFMQLKTGEIAPTNIAPVIIPAKGERIDAVPMKWGFNSPQNNGVVINARNEGIYDRYMFKNAIKNKRCIIPTNGFYEWKKYTDGKKSEKYLIKKETNPMLYLAGIYDTFIDPKTGKKQVHFVIITKESWGVIRSLHHRMPVNVEKKDILKWLNGSELHVAEIFDGNVSDFSLKNVSVQNNIELNDNNNDLEGFYI